MNTVGYMIRFVKTCGSVAGGGLCFNVHTFTKGLYRHPMNIKGGFTMKVYYYVRTKSGKITQAYIHCTKIIKTWKHSTTFQVSSIIPNEKITIKNNDIICIEKGE